MLLSFSVKNYGPFRDRAVLDMRAAHAYKELPDNTLISSTGERVLRTAAIYGANAAGKSQLTNAYHAFRSIVMHSFSSDTQDDPTNRDAPSIAVHYTPYAFSSDPEDIEFEVEFAVADGSYRYGFTYDGTMVTSEWMYFTNAGTGRQSMLIERFEDLELGASIRAECNRFRYLVNDTTLVLSLFARMNLKTARFRDLMGCIEGFIAYASPSHACSWDKALALFGHGLNEATHSRLLGFLSAIDAGIKDIRVEKLAGKIDVRSVHVGEDGAEHELPLSLESDGTIKAIVLFFILGRAARDGGGLFIDELSSELHPLLERYIVSLFHREQAGGQLIFTTHDSSLLDKDLMRRDQIWFVEKDDAGRALLYSLVEFRLKPGVSFEDRYLRGTLGSVPRLGTFDLGGDGGAA